MGKKVEPYPDEIMQREEMKLKTYQYYMPFNYENIEVKRRYQRGQEFHGVEMNPVNSIALDKEHYPPDTIEIEEKEPIVRVVVIGSSCVPPGYVQLEAKPIESFNKEVDVPGTTAARFRINNLWGMHMRCDNWLSITENEVKDQDGNTYDEIPEGRKKIVPGLAKYSIKSHYRENPLIGMSCAIFEIPPSTKIKITGGAEICAWTDDNFPDDVHYSFKIIRVTVDRNCK